MFYMFDFSATFCVLVASFLELELFYNLFKICKSFSILVPECKKL